MAISYRFAVRRRSAADWTSLNEVLLNGEFGLESDTRKLKTGDGVTAWNALDYIPYQPASEILDMLAALDLSGEAGSLLKANATEDGFEFGSAPGSGTPAIEHSVLGADVVIATTTESDVFSISLDAGIWLVTATINVVTSAGQTPDFILTDGTTVYDIKSQSLGTVGWWYEVDLIGKCVLASTTTVKVRVKSQITNNLTFKAASNGLGTAGASRITAIRIPALGAGTGDVVGPASAVNNRIAVFDGVTGQLIKDGGVTVADLQPIDAQLTSLAGLTYGSNALKVIRVNAGENAFELATVSAGSGDVVGPASAVNNRVVFFDGVTGKLIKDSGLTLSGSNTGDQTSIVGITGSLAEFNTALTGADFATGGGTVTGASSGTNTGDQTSIVGITGTLAEFNAALSGADFATGGGTATGTNTGDQTSIVGITGTKAQFNTALSDDNFAYIGADNTFTGANTFSANTGIGSAPITTAGLYVAKLQTGSTAAYGLVTQSTAASDVTGAFTGYYSQLYTAAASFTLGEIAHFRALQGTFGAGSGVTQQIGFYAESSLIGATANYGFLGLIPAGSNRHNLYMGGTANNYLAGPLAIGVTTASATSSVHLTKNVTGGTTAFGFYSGGNLQSDVTTHAASYRSALGISTGTQHASFAHYDTQQFSFAATNFLSVQYGFLASSTIVSATANYGFYSQVGVESGTGPGFTTRTITNVAVASNVVTITTSVAHGYVASQRVTVAATTNTQLNGSGIVIASIPTSTTFTYARTTADVASVADTGTVTPARNWNFYAAGTAANYFEGVTTFNSAVTVNAAITGTTAAAGTNSTVMASTAYAMSAAPNASYRNIIERESSHIAGRTAATYAIGSGVPAPISGTGTLAPWGVFYYDPADHPTVNGLTPKLRVRAQLFVNDTAPTGTYTVALHPVTRPASSGGAGLVIYTIGAAVASSAATAFSTPAADSSNQAVGSDFAAPAAGYYCLGFVQTGTVAASSCLHIAAQLQMRNT